MVSPAELHGLVCGLIVCLSEEAILPQLVQLVGADGLTDDASVSAFVSQTIAELSLDDMGFVPLIPDDDERLSQRIEGLANWCAGFMSGFSAGLPPIAEGDGDNRVAALPAEVQEILRDFVSICELDEDIDEADEHEFDFVEVLEYVRVGAMLIMTLMEARDDDGNGVEH